MRVLTDTVTGETRLAWDFQKEEVGVLQVEEIIEVRVDGKPRNLDDNTYPMLIDGREEPMREYGHLNVKHHTYFKPGEFAFTKRNLSLIATGEVVPVYVPA